MARLHIFVIIFFFFFFGLLEYLEECTYMLLLLFKALFGVPYKQACIFIVNNYDGLLTAYPYIAAIALQLSLPNSHKKLLKRTNNNEKKKQ